MPAERVTVTLPPELLRDLDRRAPNRSHFIQEAVRHELVRLRRDELERSLATPHAESRELAEAGLDEWVSKVLEEEVAGLVDLSEGTEVRWRPGEGWSEKRP